MLSNFDNNKISKDYKVKKNCSEQIIIFCSYSFNIILEFLISNAWIPKFSYIF